MTGWVGILIPTSHHGDGVVLPMMIHSLIQDLNFEKWMLHPEFVRTNKTQVCSKYDMANYISK
jgi:hypothetical protein